jgi:hypothetical protein
MHIVGMNSEEESALAVEEEGENKSLKGINATSNTTQIVRTAK